MPKGIEDDKDKNQNQNQEQNQNRDRSESVLDPNDLDQLLRDLDVDNLDGVDIKDEDLERLSPSALELNESQKLEQMVEGMGEQMRQKALQRFKEDPEFAREFIRNMEKFDTGEVNIPEPEEEKPIFYEFSDLEIDEIVEEVRTQYDGVRDQKNDYLSVSQRLLERKREQLANNPTWKDKIKAFFKHGPKGVDGEIEKLDLKIKAVELAKQDEANQISPEQRKQQTELIKAALAENKIRIEQRGGVIVGAVLERDFGEGLGKDQQNKLEQAYEEKDTLKSVRKDLKAQLKVEKEAVKIGEKAHSVREGLGEKTDTHEQGGKVKRKV